jgi:TolB-like protein
VISPRTTYLAIALLVMWMVSASQAQPALYNVFVKASRVAVLPFANNAGQSEAIPWVMHEVRRELAGKSVELADSETVANVLRKHRIRNTSELTVDQVQALSDELQVSYLVVGSLDEYRQTEKAGEIALSARLLHVPMVTMEWSASASRHTDDRIMPLDIARQSDVRKLTRGTVRQLFSTFRYRRSESARQVESIRLAGADKDHEYPCRKIIVQTFANETERENAGQVVTNQVLSALFRAGFEVIDLGRVRELMLSCNDLTQGESSHEILHKCWNELDADFILTGTVSEYHVGTNADGLDEPAVAFEARLVDTESGNVVWGTSLARHGTDSAVLFGVGSVHGLGKLSNDLSRKLVAEIPAVTRKLHPEPADVQTGDTTQNAR